MMCEKRCLIDAISFDNTTDFTKDNLSRECCQKIIFGTCEAAKVIMRLKECFYLSTSMRWKLLFRSRRYRAKIILERIRDCLSRSYPLG
jgi:hypothetical protein